MCCVVQIPDACCYDVAFRRERIAMLEFNAVGWWRECKRPRDRGPCRCLVIGFRLQLPWTGGAEGRSSITCGIAKANSDESTSRLSFEPGATHATSRSTLIATVLHSLRILRWSHASAWDENSRHHTLSFGMLCTWFIRQLQLLYERIRACSITCTLYICSAYLHVCWIKCRYPLRCCAISHVSYLESSSASSSLKAEIYAADSRVDDLKIGMKSFQSFNSIITDTELSVELRLA